MKKWKYWLIGAMIAVLAFVVVFFVSCMEQDKPLADNMQVAFVATKEDSSGVDVASAFELKFSQQVSPTDIRDLLSIEPALEFGLHQGSTDKEILIAPAEPLKANTLYRMTMKNTSDYYSWAFQTKNDFSLLSSLPGDKNSYIPLETGIEMNFSHVVKEDLSSYFTIAPQVEGTFEYHGKTVVFLPAQPLQPTTIYTVTVKEGYPLTGSDQKLLQDYSFSFETEKAKTGQTNTFWWGIDNRNIAFATDQVPTFSIYRYDQNGLGGKANKVDVNIYQFADVASFIKSVEAYSNFPAWAYLSREQYQVPTDKLQKTTSFTTNLVGDEMNTYLVLPDKLGVGCYLLEGTVNGMKKQFLFQVSDLTAYSQEVLDEMVVWVNDIKTGKPVVNGKVTSANKNNATTNDDGLARIPLVKGKVEQYQFSLDQNREDKEEYLSPAYTLIEDQGRNLVLYNYTDAVLGGRWNINANWHYLYVDKTIYHPDDVINFWGIVQNRENATAPKNVTAELISDQVRAVDNKPLATVSLPVSSSSFTGSFTLPNVAVGDYIINIKDGDQLIDSKYFYVRNYTKPTYNIQMTTDKKAVFAGDSYQIALNASCFEGTPAANLDVKLSVDDHSKKLQTNANGVAASTYTPQYRKYDSTENILKKSTYFGNNLANMLNVYVETPESGLISSWGEVSVLNTNMGIDIIIPSDNSKKPATVELQVNHLTVDKVNSGEKSIYEQDAFVGQPWANASLKLSLAEEKWNKIADGYKYDFINKVQVPKYRYEAEVTLVDTKELTVDANGHGTYQFTPKPQCNYRLLAEGTDSKGQRSVMMSYLYYGNDEDYQYYSMTTDKDVYQPGEKYTATINTNSKPIEPSANGRFCYLLQHNTLKDVVVSNTAYSNTFTDKDVPNLWLQGVYFDGKYYYQASPIVIAADKKLYHLNVEITPDKPNYAPGEQCKILLKVTGPDGKARDNTTVNLNLVDEALFALENQEVDLLSTLYGDVLPNYFLTSVVSHLNLADLDQDKEGAEGGGEGGGGDGTPRKNFKDNALFHTVTTDKDGKAAITVTMPDNITAWRLTYHAFNTNLEADSGKMLINVSLPFFSEVIVNPQYLVGDQPIIFLRSFGQTISNKNVVDYTVLLDNGKEKINLTAKGAATTSTPLELPKLVAGNYTLTVSSQTDSGQTDSLVSTFQVVDSFRQTALSSTATLTADLLLQGSPNSTTTLVFTNQFTGLINQQLWSLAYSNNARVESKLAGLAAQQVLATDEHFLNLAYPKIALEFSDYQKENGGISMLPYGDSDLITSVKVASLPNSGFSKDNLIGYFTSMFKIAENREQQTLALAGLASLGEPVLLEINYLVEQDLNVEEQLYLTWALVQLGDKEKAMAMFNKLLADHSLLVGSERSINSGELSLEDTALAMMISAGLMMDENYTAFYNYLLQHQDEQHLTDLEQIIALKYLLQQHSDANGSFTYTVDGTDMKVNLAETATYACTVTAEQLSKLRFKNIKGDVVVTSLYTGQPQIFTDSTDTTVARSYNGNSGKNITLTTGAVVKVTLTLNFGADLPKGTYMVVDTLPAGLKGLNPASIGNTPTQEDMWDVNNDLQTVSFMVEKKDGAYAKTYTYYARVVSGGQFTAEPAILTHTSTGAMISEGNAAFVNIKINKTGK